MVDRYSCATSLGLTGNQEGPNHFIDIVKSDADKAVNACQGGAAETNEAICTAISSYCQGNYSQAIEKLMSVGTDNSRHFAASNVQRDLIRG